MTATYILIVIWSAGLGAGSAVSMQEFSSKLTCQNAINAIKENRDSHSIRKPAMPDAICVPK